MKSYAYTKPEMKLALAMQKLEIPFESQVTIETRFGVWPFRVDFLVNRKLVVEVHGTYWHSKKRRMHKDLVKRNCLKAEGYEVLEVTDKHIKADVDKVAQIIKDHIENRRSFKQYCAKMAVWLPRTSCILCGDLSCLEK